MANLGGRKVFRNQETRLLVWITGLVPLALVVLIPLTSRDLPRDLPVMIGAAAISAFVFVRVLRIGIYTDAMGVEVRGPLKNQKIPWSQISRFDLRHGIGGVTAYIDTIDGTSVRAGAVNAGSGILPSMTKRAQTQIDELNALLVERRGHMPAPPPDRYEPKRLWEYGGLGLAFQGAVVSVAIMVIEPSMRGFMVVYGIGTVVGGLMWFLKEKRDEGRRPKSG